MIKSTDEYPLIEKGEDSQVKEHFLGIIARREQKLEHGKSSTSRLSAYIIPGLAVAILIFSAGAVVNDKFIKDKPYDYQPIDKSELRKLIKNKKVHLDRIDTSKITDMSFLLQSVTISATILNILESKEPAVRMRLEKITKALKSGMYLQL